MAERIVHPEFRDALVRTKWPFSDNATLISTTGEVIPEGMFLDAVFYPVGNNDSLHLSRITRGARQVVMAISNSAQQEVATASFSVTVTPEIINFYDAYGRHAGAIVADPVRVAALIAWPVTESTFEPSATEWVAACVVPMPEVGVHGLRLEDGTILAGDVWLVGGDGIVLTPDDNRIRVDLVGDPLFIRRRCQTDADYVTPIILRTINHIPPDNRGDFRFAVAAALRDSSILRIEPVGDGLKFSIIGSKLES